MRHGSLVPGPDAPRSAPRHAHRPDRLQLRSRGSSAERWSFWPAANWPVKVFPPRSPPAGLPRAAGPCLAHRALPWTPTGSPAVIAAETSWRRSRGRPAVTVDPCDRVLRRYPRLYGRGGPQALGCAGPAGCDCAKLELLDVTCTVGKKHDWERYEPAVSGRVAWYTFLAE